MTSKHPELRELTRCFGTVMRRHRDSLGLSQERLAHDIGASTTHYQHLEAGRKYNGETTNPSLDTILKIADGLGISVLEFAKEVADEYAAKQ